MRCDICRPGAEYITIKQKFIFTHNDFLGCPSVSLLQSFSMGEATKISIFQAVGFQNSLGTYNRFTNCKVTGISASLDWIFSTHCLTSTAILNHSAHKSFCSLVNILKIVKKFAVVEKLEYTLLAYLSKLRRKPYELA